MSSQKLSSLLKYRFVKRDSDNSQSSSGSDTQPPSQDSTQPPSQHSTQQPSTPEKNSANTPVTPLRDSCAPGTSGFTTPESPIFRSKASVVSPDSPIFRSKSGRSNNPLGLSPQSEASSPWLSKENGVLANGVAKPHSNRKAHIYPTFSDDESDSRDLLSIPNYASKMDSLRELFHGRSEDMLANALIDGDGDVENAIDILAATKQLKRIRRPSQESTDSEEGVVTQPRKRIRRMPSDSDDDVIIIDKQDPPDGLDSQSTLPYGLDSQRSDVTVEFNPGSPKSTADVSYQDKQDRLMFIRSCFKDKSKEELEKVMADHSWDVTAATLALSAENALQELQPPADSPSKKKSHKSSKQTTGEIEVSDEDEEYGSGNESMDSEDSIEEDTAAGTTLKDVIFKFFNEASLEEMMTMPGCSKKKSELILSLRPYGTWDNLVHQFTTAKGLSYNCIADCRELIKMREVLQRLMQRCEKISETMGQVVARLLHSSVNVEDEAEVTKQPGNMNPDCKLKPFQLVGLNWLKIMHRQELNGILADEMGLGKTIQAISILAHLLEEGETGPHVIIVPSSTIDNWRRECKVWCPSLKMLVYYGSQEERRATRNYVDYAQDRDEFNVILTTYNMASGSVEDRTMFKKFQFHFAIFDEGHLLKNMSSIRYQSLMRIQARRRLLLTGTPLQNNLLELMSLLCFVMPEMFIGKTDILKQMFTLIARTGNDEKRSGFEQERITHAKQIMKPFVLRRLKSEVMSQLPKKTEELEYCCLIPDQQEVYDRLIANFSQRLTLDGEPMQWSAGGGAAMLMQLRKAANHPLLHRTRYDATIINQMAEILSKEHSHRDRGALPKLIAEDMMVMSDFELHKCCLFYPKHLKSFALDISIIQESGKFRVLDEMLDYHKSAGNRVLLFSQFVMVLDIMEPFLDHKKINYLRLDGSTQVVERQRLIDKYNNDPDIFLFLLSTKAGGLGINLTSANVVILHDIDFNPYNDKQAEDRCHRVGQTREVKIIRLVSKGTVEEAILRCARQKLKLERDITATDTDDETGDAKDIVSILKQALNIQSTRLNS